MIQTAYDMYKGFLDGIKKESTAIVTPDRFNRIINDWGQDEWIKEKSIAIERDQKRIDDLSKIRVATDGEFSFGGNILYPLAPDTGSIQFSIPVDPTEDINSRRDDGTIVAQSYPKYMRLLGAMVKLQYGEGQECGLEGISDWKKVTILRSDARSTSLDNPFRKPKDSRLYYEILNEKLRIITGTTSTPYALRMEYLRYPQQIVFAAIKVYLERVRDPRYQSFLQEEMIRKRVN